MKMNEEWFLDTKAEHRPYFYLVHACGYSYQIHLQNLTSSTIDGIVDEDGHSCAQFQAEILKSFGGS